MRYKSLALILLLCAAPCYALDTVKVTGVIYESMLYSSQADNNAGAQAVSPTSSARRTIFWADSSWIDSVDAVITAGDTCIGAFFDIYFQSMDGTGDGDIGFYPMWKIPRKEYTYADSASAAGSNGFNPTNDSTPTWNDWLNDDLEWGTAGCGATQDISGSTNYFNTSDASGVDRTATACDTWTKTGGTTYNARDTVALPPGYVNIAYNATSGIGVFSQIVSGAFTAYFKTAEGNTLWAAELTLIFDTPAGGGGGSTATFGAHNSNLHEANRHDP